jgi:two-component system KDP operon response regulator KdpE
MKATTIFVRDTSGETARLLRRLLPRAYKVLRVETRAEVIEGMKQHAPDLLCLDPLALDICVLLREMEDPIPIIVLGSSCDTQGIVRALDLGADDYVTAPFSLDELAARIRALLRRSQGMVLKQEALHSEDGYLHMLVEERQVFTGEQRVSLTKTEFAFLHYLMRHADHVVTNRTLLQTIWGPEYGEENDYIRVYVRQIRCKLEPDPSHPTYIRTVSGVGYIFRSVLEPVKETCSSRV